jgi:hypothetical protein
MSVTVKYEDKKMMTPTHEFKKKKRKAEYLKKRRENWGHVKLKPTAAKMKRRPKKIATTSSR